MKSKEEYIKEHNDWIESRRRTGKTTRLVDKAIQLLFDKGEIMILTNHEIFDREKQWKRGLKKEQIEIAEQLIDRDVEKGNKAQEHFFLVLSNRLLHEHYGSYIQLNRKFKVKL